MSVKKSATRRLGLLAGSSLIAGLLSATGAVVAPSAALAQATCSAPPVVTGNGTTAVTIAANTAATSYEPGITCTYTGADSTVSTAGAVTVSSAPGGDGVNLSATGTSVVNWNSAAGRLTGGVNTNGPVIDATSVSGAINITTAGVSGPRPGTTYGIYAKSTGGGAIAITGTAFGAVNINAAGGQAAIFADTNGGDIEITTDGGTNGRAYGILAQTSGAGAITMDIIGATASAKVATDGVDGVAIEAIAGTGGVDITIRGGSVNTSSGGVGGAGPAIRVATTGSAVIDNVNSTIGVDRQGIPNGGGSVDFSGAVNGVTFTHGGASATTGRWQASGDSIFSAGDDTLNMNGVGFNHMAPDSSIDFGAGDDVFNMDAFFNIGLHATPNTAVLDFGSGEDTFNMSGVFSTHTVTLYNLENFNNSGVIYMGAAPGNTGNVDFNRTDGAADDRLSLPGTTFTGSVASRIVMDVELAGGVQAGCETMTGVADCLYLPNGATDGVTTLTLNNLGPAAYQAGYDTVGITLVDVAGGTSAQDDFVLDPSMAGVTTDALYGQVMERPGLFVSMLRYDDETQRHILVTLPRSEVLRYAIVAGAAQSIWHMTTEAVTDRQTELRRGAEGGSVWLRGAAEYSKRDASSSFSGGVGTFTVDNSYKLYAGTVMGGMDLVAGTSGGYDYVLGAQIGYVSSSLELTAGQSSGRMTGATGGLYGSIWSERLFLDGTFNMNGLTLDYDSPALGARTNTYLNSVGARLDGGMRWMLTERTFVEPLVTFAFARTSFEEISLAGGEVQPGDANSRRGALGLRLGADLTEGPINVGYFVTGRAWQEFEGDAEGVVHNPGAALPFADEFSGSFGEAEAGVNLFNDTGSLSGFLTSGVKFKDGYSAVNLSLGVRMAW